MISVVMVTYKRCWALPFSLSSLVEQTYSPDEVIVVLKPSGDNSEAVIESFSKHLNINLIIQEEGNVVDAYSLGIEKVSGKSKYVAFLDDDCITEKQWLQKYLDLFEKLPNAGGIGGIVYKAFISDKMEIVKTKEEFSDERITVRGIHRRPPLLFLKDYDGHISVSGFPARRSRSAPIVKSVMFGGANMAFRRDAIMESGLSEAYKESRIGHLFEQYLALCARLRGYDVYRVIDPSVSPTVWHIHHPYSLQRTPLKSEFWRSYDLAYNYWRLKYLGLKTSFPRYLAGLIVTLRRKMNIRLPAYTYGAIKGALFYLKRKRRS